MIRHHIVVTFCCILIGLATPFQLSHLIKPSTTRRTTTTTTNTELSQSSFSTSTTIDITESAPRDIASLYEWGANYGIQTCDGFELTSDDGVDVYAMTHHPLPAHSPIICVPSDLVLTGSKAREELGGDAFRAEQILLNSHDASSEHMAEISERISQFYLVLKVLAEYERGVSSPWYPWLNSLPRFYCNGASMTDFCFGCLPPYAAELALAEKKRLNQFVEALKEVPFLSQGSKGDVDLTTWAYSVVQTRCSENPDDGDVCLVPMADFFNHQGAETDVYLSYDDDGNCFAYTTQDVPAGQPLRVCCGDPTNPSKLLAKYGFLDESSSATFAKYIVSNPTPEIFDMGYPAGMLFYQDGSISQEVWDTILYKELDKVRTLVSFIDDGQQSHDQAHSMADRMKCHSRDQCIGAGIRPAFMACS